MVSRISGRARTSATRASRDRAVASATRCQDRAVQARAQGTERRPVDPGQRQAGGLLPGRCQPEVGIQGRKQPAGWPGRLPPQREHGGLTAGHHIQGMHLDQLGHGRHLAQRADPGQPGQAITVGSLRHVSQQPRPSAASPALPPRPGNSDPPAPRQIQTSTNRTRKEDHPARGQSPIPPAPSAVVVQLGRAGRDFLAGCRARCRYQGVTEPGVICGANRLLATAKPDGINLSGDPAVLGRLMPLIDSPVPDFAIVTAPPSARYLTLRAANTRRASGDRPDRRMRQGVTAAVTQCLMITSSGGMIWRPAGGRANRPGRTPSVTAHGGDGDQRPDAEPDDQDDDIVPGVVARGDPAHSIGAGCHRHRPADRVQEILPGELIWPHLGGARDDGGGEEHGQPAPSGVQPLAPLDYLLPARLMSAWTLQRAPPAAADGVAAEPAASPRWRPPRSPPPGPASLWLAATAAAPRAAVPMTGTPAHEAAAARNSSRYCHQAFHRLAAIMRSPTPAATSGTPGFPRLRAVRAAVRVEGYVAADRRASRPLSSCSARGGRSPWRTGTRPPRLGSTWTRPAACSPHSSPGALPPGKPTWWFDVCLSLCFRGNVVAAPVYAVRAGRPGGRAAAGRPAAGSQSLVAARGRPAFAPVGGRAGHRRGGRCLWRSGAPGTVGGKRCCRGPAPDPARLAALGAPYGRACPTACPGRSAFQREISNVLG